MNDTPLTHIQIYRRSDGKQAVQLATQGVNGWLCTHGLQADLARLSKRHRALVLHATLNPPLPDLPEPPDIDTGMVTDSSAQVDFADGPSLDGWVQETGGEVGHCRGVTGVLAFMASFDSFKAHLLSLSWINDHPEGDVAELYRRLYWGITGEVP